ncbi:transporter ESBP6 [Lecanosticta acicola]|uniref:Transporter ESBP6 n=1 Tax=Lecanosticta acicola TaxID=111012 RepID=A0AAI8YYF0_9PEZI|nr:transporter ESBP6 [Lecanosticta acicola]
MAWRESPLHSPSTSNWQSHHRESVVSNFSRPTTQDSFQPYVVSESADLLSNKPVLPKVSQSGGTKTPRQTFLSSGTSLTSRPISTGYHPGFPGPYAPVPSDSQTWLESSNTTIAEKSDLQAFEPKAIPSGPPGGLPPDGGLTAWLQVLGGYFLFFNTWGLINAFGVFQTYYKSDLISDKSNSTIAWVGTLTSFLLCASPISWGPIFDIGSPRLLVLFGSFAVVFGIMMTSLCNAYWQIMLAQGVICGIGGGALFITATSVLPSYFSRKRALAMGISASGSSLGGIIYPIIFRYVQPTFGFGWAVRIIGFIALLTLSIPCLVIKPRAKPPGGGRLRKIFDTRILKEAPFAMMNLATFFGFVGQYIPYFFIEQFASQHQESGTTDPALTFWMLIFLNVGSIPGRILPSLLADRRFHPLHVLACTTAAAALLAFCWIAIRASTAGLVLWCLLYGFCSGAFVSLQGAAVASMTRDLASIGTRFGVNMFAGALGILIGSPVGGAIFPTSWAGAQAFCGGSLAVAAAAVVGTYALWKREQKGIFRGKM